MSGRVTRFLGDSPLRVFFRLLVLSFVVGLVLSTLNIRPLQVFSWAERILVGIYEMGFSAIEQAAGYLVIGAIVVVPIFLLTRLVKTGGRRGE